MTRVDSNLASAHARLQQQTTNTNLEIIGLHAGVDSIVVRNPSQGPNAPISQGAMADAIKAIIGAVFLDSQKDLEAVKRTLRNLGIGPV